MRRLGFIILALCLAGLSLFLLQGEAAPEVVPAGDVECSNWQYFHFPEEGRFGVQHCLVRIPPPSGWSLVVWYLRESGCSGSQCSSTWEPVDQRALFEYTTHRIFLEQDQAPGDGCTANGIYPGWAAELYEQPSYACCANCSTWDGRDQCVSETGEIFAPWGSWHQTKTLHAAWEGNGGKEVSGCLAPACYRYTWTETWPDANPQEGHWSFAEEDNCRAQPGFPTPTPGGGEPPGPSPTPTPHCVPGTCYPQCSFPDLQVNGRPAEEEPPGPALDEGPVTVSLKAPYAFGGCPDAWHFIQMSLYPVGGGAPLAGVVAREAKDVPTDLPPNCYEGGELKPRAIYVEWSDGERYCVGWKEPIANTFHYVPIGDYYIDGVLQRKQCGIGFTTNCTWYFGLGSVPTETASLRARAEYWSEHDPNYPIRGPDNPYRTSGAHLQWNYGEVLPVHPTADWEEPTFPGWTANTRVLRWQYLGSTTSSGRHPAHCEPPDASSCSWQEENPRRYIYLRWYKYLMSGETEGVAEGDSRTWVYRTDPVTVSLSYQVQAETVWTKDADPSHHLVYPITQDFTMTVRLRYLRTYDDRWP